MIPFSPHMRNNIYRKYNSPSQSKAWNVSIYTFFSNNCKVYLVIQSLRYFNKNDTFSKVWDIYSVHVKHY